MPAAFLGVAACGLLSFCLFGANGRADDTAIPPAAHAYSGITIERAVGMDEMGGYPATVTSDGRWIAYGIHRRYPSFRSPDTTGVPASEWAGSSILIYDTARGTSSELTKGWGASWGATWSPDGRNLAFYSNRNGRLRLWIWKRESDSFMEYPQCDAAPNSSLDWLNRLQWSADGMRVFFRAWSPKVDPGGDAGSSPIVWDSTGTGDGKDDGPKSRLPALSFDLDAAEMATGSVEVLLRRAGIMNFAVSPDGASAAVFGNPHPLGSADSQSLLDLYVIKTVPLEILKPGQSDEGRISPATPWETRSEPVIFRDIRQFVGEQLAFSPDGRKVAWCTLGALADNDIYCADLSDGNARNISGDVQDSDKPSRINFSTGKKFGERLSRDVWRILWTADSAQLLVAAEKSGGVWLLSANGGPAKKVFQRPGVSGRVTVLAPTAHDEIKYSAPDEIAIETTETGGARKWWRASLGSGIPDGSGGTAAAGVCVDWALSDDLMLVRKDGDLWTARGALTDIKFGQITHLEAENRPEELGAARWIAAKLGGRDLRGLLLTPVALPAKALAKEGASGSKGLPLVVWVYAGSGSPSESQVAGDSEYNGANTLVKRGYAVLFAAIPTDTTGNATRSILDPVLAQVGAAVATGLIDEARIGVFGWSNGGYTVDTLITHTDRFKAAVSVAGYGDVFSLYLGGKGKMPTWMAGVQAPGGQPGLAVGLWRDPLRYLDNSPACFLNDVITPLLLIHGEKDENIPINQSFEMYHGLANLGKRVRFVQYPGEGHAIDSSPAVVQDLWGRVLGWYDQFIGPAAGGR